VSLFDGFINTIKDVVGGVLGGVVQGGAGIASQQAAGPQAQAAVPALQAATQHALATSGVKPVGQASTDLLLKASEPVNKVISTVVNRPVATVGLLTDPSSPLYTSEQYGQGFQFSDIAKAYDRSAKVSPFQAMTKSSIFQDSPFGMLSDRLLKEGGVNLQKVNLWDNKDIEKNFIENPAGKWFTGLGDFVLSNVALGGVTGLAKGALGAGLKATNLTTSITSEADLAKMDALADAHITHLNTKAQMGTPTVFGADVQQLAETKDMNLIVDKVRDYSNNERLPGLIQKATNPSVVKDLLLADKGYMPALERLGTTAPADLWELHDMNSFIKGNVAATGVMPTFEGDALSRTLAAFDQAISESPAHKEIYDAFLTPEGDVKALGNAYKPVDPKFFAETIGNVRTRVDAVKAAATTREFGDVGGATEHLLGGGLNRPVTALVRFIGTQKPRGYITFSGARPWDGVDEIHSMFDDIRMFTRGETPITTGYEEVAGALNPIKTTAADYRNKVVQDFMNAQTPSEKAAVIDELDQRIGHDIARTLGITNKAEIDNFVTTARNILNTSHTALSRDGFAFDAAGRRIIVDPQTQRQLADSVAMLPWGKIERDMRAMVKTFGAITESTPGVAHSAFEGLNKIFSLSVLGRPAYIPKNSMAEPLISAFLSMGHDYMEGSVGTTASNFIKNNTNRILSGVTKIADRSKIKNVNEVVSNKMNKLNEAIQYRDTAYAEYENAFNTDSLSPAAKREHLDTIKSNLREAQALVGRLEAETDVAVKPYGKLDNIPSVYSLNRRIEFLNKNAAVAGKYGSDIASAKLLLQKAIGNIHTLSPDIMERNNALEKAWKVIDNIVEDSKLATKEQAEILARREGYKQRFYGTKEPHLIKVGDQQMPVESLFDQNKFGDALRSEFSNEDTQELNFLSELRTGSKAGLLARKGPTGIVDINDPVYFEELAYVVNRQMRGDLLVDRVLEGQSPQQIMEWAKTKEGVEYLRQFGLESPGDMTSIIQDRINFVKRYLPDDAARAYALKNTVTSVGLQKFLADKLDILSPIHPLDIDYGTAATLGKTQIAMERAQDLMNAGWKKLASAENPYRWLWADKKFAQVIENKINILHEQGVPITTESINALRQASYREALDEAGKVFYTIRRQNRALYAARTVAAFPSASANALYRFGRLGIKNPARMAGFMRNYYGVYDSFGVDKNGNPVDNPEDATHIVVPGTKEMGLFGEQGIRLSTKAFGFLANTPGPSWLSTMAIGHFLASKPDNAKITKSIIDNTIGHLPGMNYDNLFPMGVDSSVGSGFIPSWLSDAVKYVKGNDSSADFLQVHRMVNNYQMTLFEMKLGPKPTNSSVMQQTRDWFGQRALWRFASPFGMAPKQDKPGQLFQDYGSLLLKKYNGDANKAQAEMMQVLGTSFPTDRYLYRGNTKAAYIAPTYEGYARVWENNKNLAKQLEQLDPKAVGLLTSDITGDPDPQVQKYLSNPGTALPGGALLNAKPLTPEQYETNLTINRAWNAYRTTKDSILTQLRKATDNPKARIADFPEAKAAWNNYVAQLAKYSPQWFDDYNQNATGDNAYTMAKGMQMIVNDPVYKNRTDNYWQQVKTFINYRNKMVDAYNSKEADLANAKTAIQQAWVSYLQNDTAGAWDPRLQQIIDRYFVNDSLKRTK